MKKIIIFLSVIIGFISYSKMISERDMIRFRIISNSNEEIDQETKLKIVKSLKEELTYKAKTKKEEKNYIISNIPVIKNKINNVLNNNKFTINYGMNYFPSKEYNGIKYDEGMYESLVVTIGEGEGSNFWCILFPPICTIPDEEIEYKSFLKEALNKFF